MGERSTDSRAADTASETFCPLDPAAPRNVRIFLVVVDDSDELSVALRYASLRARNCQGRVALLYVMEPNDIQHWGAVEELMRQEQRNEAEQRLQRCAKEVHAITGGTPVFYLREGDRQNALLQLLDEEPSISVLVLAASLSSKGPGPLISYFTGRGLSRLHIPLTIVPGNLSREQVEAIT